MSKPPLAPTMVRVRTAMQRGVPVESLSFTLPDDQMPTAWYNIRADLDEPLAPKLRPDTKEPVRPEDLEPLFPTALVEQEFTTERHIDIPGPVLDGEMGLT